MNVLVINAGSSSVKYKLFDMRDESPLAEGVVDRIGLKGSTISHQPLNKQGTKLETDIPDYETALNQVIIALTHHEHGVIKDINDIYAIGHRVVHGGEKISASVLIDSEVEEIIRDCFVLAPLHNPPNLMGIQACKKLLPDIKQVAVFDTSFHLTIPEEAYLYAIPYRLYEEYAIRRYGFHGTSHRYVAGMASEIIGKPLIELKMITCHLGNGCSITAVKNGKSIDTSMGFTPLEGLIMGTRSGDIDPAIIFYLIERVGLSVQDINSMLNRDSGLLGLSGISRDMRDILKSAKDGNKRASTTIDCFVYKIRKYIGAYATSMGGLDAIVFTAGIGENSAKIRAMVCERLEFLGVKIDDKRNDKNERNSIISTDDSTVKVLVISTNEELLIARDTINITEGRL
ncbi:TPA: acetate kinase [bacterium]|nr:acetate kinase [bacterium]